MQADNSCLYAELREKYPTFIYHGYKITDGEGILSLDYDFEIPGLSRFAPHWEIDTRNRAVCHDDIDELVFSLGMVELVSYWKTACPKKVLIYARGLDDYQTKWWKKLYKKGLGEFFYTNGITPDEDFMTIESCGRESQKCPHPLSHAENAVLVPIGGGKDSAVTLELLCGFDRHTYIINPRGATVNTVDVSGLSADKNLIAKRTLDKNMLSLNAKGFLNGHTPFSALVAFSSVLTAYIGGLGYVALSNESSANEATVAGTDVNHQYSKSFEFECDFAEYHNSVIGSGVEYFSMLRPLSEVGIAKIFASLEKYHAIFRSCNAGSKADIWCGKCPKCLFVYIILAPFVSADGAKRIFGRDLLSDITLQETLEKLAGALPEKPFECVGSRKEVNAALQELIKQFEACGRELLPLLKHYKALGIEKTDSLSAIASSYDENNRVPEKFAELIKQHLG